MNRLTEERKIAPEVEGGRYVSDADDNRRTEG